METKRCYRCKQEKPLSEFGVDRRSRDGLNGCCKACKKLYNAEQKEYLKEYLKTYRKTYKRDLSYCREYSSRYRKEHPETCKKTNAKWRAEQAHNPGTFNEQDVLACLDFFNNECAYSGVPITSDYHLDHVIPLSKGGENSIHNIVPCLSTINLLKSAKDFEEWYPKQSFFSESRYNRIKEWMKKREE